MPEQLSAETAKPVPHPGRGLRERAGSWLTRILLGMAGLGLIVGFFMPWLGLGQVAALSGFSMLLTQGEAVDTLSGSHRVMLLAVPLLGAALIAGAVFAHRLMVWVAAVSGACVLAFGLITLVSLFLASTGLGLWIVVGSALLAFVVGLLNIGRRRRSR